MSEFKKVGMVKGERVVQFGNEKPYWIYSDGENVSSSPDGSDPWKHKWDVLEFLSRGIYGYFEELESASDEITDTERLEWLIKSETIVKRMLTNIWCLIDSDGQWGDDFKSPREAIDDAMRGEGK